MENGKRRLIPNPETFNAMGLNGNAIKDIAGGDLNNIPEGAPIPPVNYGSDEPLTRQEYLQRLYHHSNGTWNQD
ncbi:MAG TPA: hypothetical protein V6D26_21960 [Stenomitos sp.]